MPGPKWRSGRGSALRCVGSTTTIAPALNVEAGIRPPTHTPWVGGVDEGMADDGG